MVQTILRRMMPMTKRLQRNTRTISFSKTPSRPRFKKWPRIRETSHRRRSQRDFTSSQIQLNTESCLKRCSTTTVSYSGSKINNKSSSKRQSSVASQFPKCCPPRKRNYTKKQRKWQTSTVGLYSLTSRSALATTAMSIVLCSSSLKSCPTRKQIDTFMRL